MQIYCVLEKILNIQFQRKKLLTHLSVSVLCGLLLWINTKNEAFRFIFRPIAIFEIIRSYLVTLVSEKSDKQKENQLRIGLSLISYYFGWILACLLQTFISSILYQFMEIIYIYYNFHWQNITLYSFIVYFFQYQLFAFAIVGQMLFLSSFFISGKKAAEFYIFLNIFVYSLNYLQLNDTITFCLFPQMSLQFKDSLLLFAIQGFLGIILYLYIDQIMPDQFGTEKNPFFCCKDIFRRHNRLNTLEDIEVQQKQLFLGQDLLNNRSEYYQQDESQELAVVRIYNLTKTYKKSIIVDHLNLNLYRNQIFCLLGHNGAGKSTTLNLICGSVKKDEGNIFVNTFDIDNQLTEIRQLLGYFSQSDVIYPDLSVNDHLIFYGKIKLVNDLNLKDTIDHLLEICKYLSGGGKRKLSLAITLIGNSEVILLDEPTTGLDPISKQQVWSILQKIKKDKCIVMTTHFLDEAQELADRIGIIQKGKLIVCGTVDYIKRQFSVGYNISIESSMEGRAELFEKIQSKINDLCQEELIYQNTNQLIKVNIPQRYGKYIALILEYLETLMGVNIFFEMTSLEDAYVQIHLKLNQDVNMIDREANYQNIFDGTQPHYFWFDQLKGLFFRRMVLAKQTLWQYLLLVATQVILFKLFEQFEENFKFKLLYACIKYIFVYQFANYPIYEKQLKIKNSMVSHGMNPINYWISNLLFDALSEAVISVCIILFIYFEITIEVKWLKWQYRLPNIGFDTILMYYQFSINLICQTYAATCLFKNTLSSSVLLPLLFLLQIPIAKAFCMKDEISSVFLKPILPYYNFIAFCGNCSQFDFYFNSFLSSTIYFFVAVGIDRILTSAPSLPKEEKSETSETLNSASTLPIQNNIKVFKIKQQFNGNKQIKNVSFNVERKQIYGLLGQNGSGKTAIMNVLARVNKPKSGTVLIINEKTEIGYVPQHFSLWEDLTSEQHLYIYGKLKGLNKHKITNFITGYSKIMDLGSIKNKKVQYFSVGEQRKLLIGIALIGGSSKLIMDEPTSGVDPVYKKEFQNLIKCSCQINNSSIVLATPSLSEAEEICDAIGIMINGELKFDGTINELRFLLDNRIQISFLMKDSRNKDMLDQIIKTKFGKKAQQVQEGRLNKVTYFISLEIKELTQLFRFCSSNMVSQLIIDFEIKKATLDQVFKNYIQQLQIDENEAHRSLNQPLES